MGLAEIRILVQTMVELVFSSRSLKLISDNVTILGITQAKSMKHQR